MTVAALLDALEDRVPEANFYRFCQLLERAAPGRPPLGSTTRFADDAVRFRPDPGMGFPAGELGAIERDPDELTRPATVRARFMGLYGVDSPLPTAYLDDIAQQREGHEALEAFLDIFNHRLYTQLYRIWRKYCYPANFEPGGTDATSQCLLGLIGLGIPGTARQIGTPISRFLALLGVMRMPTRNAEGICALVALLAPHTSATVRGHALRSIALAQPSRLGSVILNSGTPLGRWGRDINSELRLTLETTDSEALHAWLPGGQLHSDLLVLLRVYLGWRCTARLVLRTPVRALPAPVLGTRNLRLNLTAVASGGDPERHLLLNLGRYQGLHNDAERAEFSYVDRMF